MYKQMIEQVGRSSVASGFYSEADSFESERRHQTSRLRFFVVSLSLLKEILEDYLKLGLL
jgi:hypothetical protein